MAELLTKIKFYLEQFCKTKETGKITFEINISRGGIGQCRIVVDKTI